MNNAGFGICGFFSEGDLDLELEMIRLNIESLHILTKLYLSTMSKGVIMNVASVAGFIPTPLMATYAATKAYVNNFSRALNYEMKVQKRDIRVLSLCPGPVKTDFWTIAKANQSKYALPVERCARAAVKGIINNKLVIIRENDEICSTLNKDIAGKLDFANAVQDSKKEITYSPDRSQMARNEKYCIGDNDE